MASTAHVVLRPQVLSSGTYATVARPQRYSPTYGTPTPAQVGCGFSSKEKWQQKFGHASLRASLDLTEPSAEESSFQRKAQAPRRFSGHGKPRAPSSKRPRTVTAVLTPSVDEADLKKEESMVYRRTFFGHPEWLRHRSSSRHSRHIFSIAGSRVVFALGPPVLALTGVATIVALYNEAIIDGYFPNTLPLLKASALPFQLTAPALALLLVFRTNASYSRFDEARKFWGATLNRLRDLGRQACSYMEDKEERDELLRYLMAFPYTFKDHMQRGDFLMEDVKNILNPQEIEALLASEHRPNYCLQMMSGVLSKTDCVTDFQRMTLDHNLTHFSDQVGGCERIFKTPLPLSYTRLTSRFLVLWHLFLPFALWDACHLSVVPATFLSASALFCIEEVGVLIEEPFSLLPLNAISNTAEKNIRELMRVHEAHMAKRGPKAIDVEPQEQEQLPQKQLPQNGAATQNGSAAAAVEKRQQVTNAVVSAMDTEVDSERDGLRVLLQSLIRTI